MNARARTSAFILALLIPIAAPAQHQGGGGHGGAPPAGGGAPRAAAPRAPVARAPAPQSGGFNLDRDINAPPNVRLCPRERTTPTRRKTVPSRTVPGRRLPRTAIVRSSLIRGIADSGHGRGIVASCGRRRRPTGAADFGARSRLERLPLHSAPPSTARSRIPQPTR
jgi:hypothetical protein